MSTDNSGPSWHERMAQEMERVAQEKPSAAFFRLALEAAGELKAVRLKMLLGKATAYISSAIESGDAPKVEEGFLDECDKELT